MKNILSLCLLSLFVFTSVSSQNKKDVLLTINDKPVYSNEFERVYKKNLELVQDESQKDIDGYLQLFIDYKLKIAEAKAQNLDKTEEYFKEFIKYRDQLSRNYLYENQVTENLAKEAYERSKQDINAAHILISVDYEALPQDTLAAYNKIKNIRERALKGEDFEKLAKTYSEEPNANETGGNLGYFTVFSMVYPFENAAYNTKVGEISEIIRTNYGYHILKVKDKREHLPKISVSHIMISDKKGARNFDPEARINEIYTMLQQGENFESLAKQFSDDKNSAVLGGSLKPFTKGDLRAPEFENMAYTLENPGDLSKPIQTDFGWHIIRLDEKHPRETFEEMLPELEKKVNQGDRSRIITNKANKKIKEKYGFTILGNYSPYFYTYLGDEILKRSWSLAPVPEGENKPLFAIGDKEVTYADFAEYIYERQKTTRPYRSKEKLLSDFYDEFETKELKEYYRERLEFENEEYAAILNEYRDGLLIFEVMNKNIWQKGKKDTLGLQQYYAKTKQEYQWKQRIDADIFTATSQAFAKQVKAMLEEGKTGEEIKNELNTNGQVNVLITNGIFETDRRELPQTLEIKKGVSEIYSSNDSFVVVNIKEIIAPGPKSFEDVRGKVLTSFQNDIEASWMESLHSKYDVVVNKRTLRRIKRNLK